MMSLLSFLGTVWSGSTLYAIINSQICQMQHSDHYFPFSVWLGATLFAILSSLINIYTVCHSKQSEHGLHCLPFSAVWSVSTLFAILSKQSDWRLHSLPFAAVWSESTTFAILSLIRVNILCHSQQSDQDLHYLPFFLSSIMKVYAVCHSQQSNKGLHYLSFSAVWSGSTLFAILSSLISFYTICYSF